MDVQMSDYTTCPKCGLQHSTLVRHKCAKPKGQPKGKAPEEGDPTDGTGVGAGKSLDEHQSETSGHGDSQGESQDGQQKQGDSSGQNGDGQGEQGQGQPQDGEGQDGEGSGQQRSEDEGEGKGRHGQGDGGEREAPQPQPPEPEARPEAIICTVLKFAALTAQCAKNGTVEITVTENGLMVYGHNGDLVAFDTMSWKDFENRSTVDGEFYVKEVIDRIDAQLLETEAPVVEETDMVKRIREAIEQHKAEQSKEIKPPEAQPKKTKRKLTVPMFVGQKVVCRDGKVREVSHVKEDVAEIILDPDEGGCWPIWAKSERKYSRKAGTAGPKRHPYDALYDYVEGDEVEPTLTLPLTIGQKVIARNGSVGEVIMTHSSLPCVSVAFTGGRMGGQDWWYSTDSGLFDGEDDDPDYERHLVADA